MVRNYQTHTYVSVHTTLYIFAALRAICAADL